MCVLIYDGVCLSWDIDIPQNVQIIQVLAKCNVIVLVVRLCVAAFFHPLLNTGVHVLMYTYYGLSVLGSQWQRYLWWKKYLTTLQLVSKTVRLAFRVIIPARRMSEGVLRLAACVCLSVYLSVYKLCMYVCRPRYVCLKAYVCMHVSAYVHAVWSIKKKNLKQCNISVWSVVTVEFQSLCAHSIMQY